MRKTLLILSFIALTFVQSQAQGRENPGTPGTSLVRFYPNPATTVINFDFQRNTDRGYSIQIYSFLGRKMYEQSNLADKTTISLAEFTRGVYIYQLRDKTGRIIESGKFQVSK